MPIGCLLRPRGLRLQTEGKRQLSKNHPRPWHKGSLFGPGPRRPLDRNERARYRFLLNAHRRAGRLTPCGQLVGTALLRRLGEDGECDPAHATLAEDAGCCERTVRRALVAMRLLGLLHWVNRLVRVELWRAEQTSNAYVLTPESALPACDGQNGRATLLTRKVSTSPPLSAAPTMEPVTAREALAAIAARRYNEIFTQK